MVITDNYVPKNCNIIMNFELTYQNYQLRITLCMIPTGNFEL